MPNASRTSPFTTLPLNLEAETPLFRQLHEQIRRAILEGHLKPGERIPSTRGLAESLELSRNTVSLAYDQLLAEGYLEGRTGSGTFVSRTLPEEFFRVAQARTSKTAKAIPLPALSDCGMILADDRETLGQRGRDPRPFERVLPALDEFPTKIWARLVARHWKRSPTDIMGYGDPAGFRPLREALASHLGTTRGVNCTADQIVIVPGHLDLLSRLLLNPGDRVWVEDPTYIGFRKTLAQTGATLCPIPVDGEGLNVQLGQQKWPAARLALVTPSCQYPLGVTMSLARRMELLDWARRSGAWIIEDDYGSEYRYHGRPLASLQGLDRNHRVIYIGSLSRVLFPALRASFIVAPPVLVDPLLKARAALFGPQNTFDQSVIADFFHEGHFVRHLRRMRTLYAERQDALLKAASRHLSGLLELAPLDGGMFLVGWLPRGVNDVQAARRATEAGITTDPISPMYFGTSPRHGLLLGYCATPPRRIREGVRILQKAVRPDDTT